MFRGPTHSKIQGCYQPATCCLQQSGGVLPKGHKFAEIPIGRQNCTATHPSVSTGLPCCNQPHASPSCRKRCHVQKAEWVPRKSLTCPIPKVSGWVQERCHVVANYSVRVNFAYCSAWDHVRYCSWLFEKLHQTELFIHTHISYVVPTSTLKVKTAYCSGMLVWLHTVYSAQRASTAPAVFSAPFLS